MTRENKLALVIGFGLLLLAGILVSDHLSAQKRMEEDPLQAVEPRWVPDQDILQFPNPRDVTPEPAPSETQRMVSNPRPATPSTVETPRQIVIGGAGNSASSSRETAATRNAKRFHYVKSGESLSRIAKNYYGDSNQWVLIKKHNPSINEDALQIGTRLVIPKQGIQVATSQPAPPSRAPRIRTTVVREGESLSDIARRELGDGSKWPKIHEANRSTLPNADRLNVGMVLKVPVTDS
jgi:nucleoid-associated protein YgaU